MKNPRKIGTVTIYSMLIGALSAAILTLGVFAGGTEPVITGSGMVGIAIGWLALAILSTKYTDQPQRWAYVLGTYFGIVGLILLVTRPGDNFISASGWVWPFLVLALAVWSFLQARIHLRSRTRRWVIYPVILVLMLSAIGGVYEKVQERTNVNKFTMTGELIDIGGFRLHIDCTGTGSPTVVLESGLGDTAFAMKGWIAPSVANHTRVCVYDRAGRGWSDASPYPLDGEQTAAALNTLLLKAGEKGPFVLAGHSAGGAYVLNYSLSYPKDVAGVILLDSMSPYQYEKIPGWRSFYAMFTRGSAVLPSLSRVGLMRGMMAGAYDDFPEDIAQQQRNALSSPKLYRSERDEFSVIRKSLTRAQQLETLGDLPLVVVTAKGSYPEWQSVQTDLVSLSSNSKHVVLPNAEHTDLVYKKDVAAESSQAIISIVEAIRNGKSLIKE